MDPNGTDCRRPTVELAVPLLVACERVVDCALVVAALRDRDFIAYATPVLLAAERYFLLWGTPYSRWRLDHRLLERSHCVEAAGELRALCDLVGWPSEIRIEDPASLQLSVSLLKMCLESSPMGRLRGDAAFAFARLAE